jgi:tetratricopeptide (TPR) repeat protein
MDNFNNNKIENFNKLYTSGQYTEALSLLLSQGLKTDIDYYNAANCYYKLNKKNLSLSYYKKALALNVNNHYALKNLEITEAELLNTGKIQKNYDFVVGKLYPLTYKINPLSISLPLFLTTILLLILIFKYISQNKNLKNFLKFNLNLFTFILFWILFCINLLFFYLSNLDLAVIIDEKISDDETAIIAKSGPASTYIDKFKIPIGSTVRIINKNDENWVQIKFSNDKIGWVEKTKIMEL